MAPSFNNIQESLKSQGLFKAQRTPPTSWNPSFPGDDSLLNCWYSPWPGPGREDVHPPVLSGRAHVRPCVLSGEVDVRPPELSGGGGV